MTGRPGPGLPADDFSAKLEKITTRLEQVRPQLAGDPSAAVLTQDLDTAYEELRTADEEVRTQQAQISRLLEGQQLLRWQHDRVLAMIPVAVLTTDARGVIRSANAAAAGLLSIRADRLTGKPIFSFVAPENRPELRRRLARQARFGSDFREVLTLTARGDRQVTAEAVVSILPLEASSERSWILLTSTSAGRERRQTSADLPAGLVGLAGLMVEASDTQTIVRRAAGICQETLGAAVTVSVVAGDPLAPVAVASTTKLAQELDGAQVRTQSGPSVLAHQSGSTVVATDIHRDDRWPALRVESPHEVVGCVSIPLEVDEDLAGCLTVYARHTAVDDLVEGSELLAATIATVLRDLRLRQELEAMASNLETALTSRATIDQAKGIVMAERRCRADEAFEYLVGLSSSRHVRLRDLAQAIVDQASEGQ